MSPWDRHPKIFEAFEELPVGDTLVIVNDHDPKPLQYTFMVEREGQFEWNTEEKGPREWVATIKKIA